MHATVGVEVAAEELSEAFDPATSAADRVIAQLREQGIAQEDIQTRDLSVRHRHTDPAPPGARQPPSGYVVRNMLEVTLRDVDRMGEVLAAAAEAGGNAARIHGLRFALEDDAHQRQAREQAIEDARTQAEHYAELLDRELGELVSVSDARGGQVPPPAAGGAGELAPPPVEPGRSSVSVQVQATWELE